ncbi:hypothetical protein [Spirosoma rigui]|uniref:hypothetical protein n=1 Tax=Spirosoma rigui TaxID=564064 RepID=UPI0009AFBB39|nr:hypothetical protein [Spirosoma rigui]
MNIQVFRQFIARMFSEECSRWTTWCSLITAYVDVRLKALAIQWIRYQRDQIAHEGVVSPESPTLMSAVVLLGKGKKLLCNLLLPSNQDNSRNQVEVLAAESQGVWPQLTEQSDQYALHTPAYNKLIQSISTKLPQLDIEHLNDEAFLQTFIDFELKLLDKLHFDWIETHEDGGLEVGEPQPSAELVQAAATLSYIQGETFASMAIALQRSRYRENALRSTVDVVEGIARTHKTNYDKLLPVAERFANQIQSYRRLFASMGDKWLN